VRRGVHESDLADIGQVAVALRAVDPMAHDEFVGDLESDPVGGDIDLAPGRLVEEGDGVEPRGIALQQMDDMGERGPGQRHRRQDRKQPHCQATPVRRRR